MSALGQKQTFKLAPAMSALPPKADVAQHALQNQVDGEGPSIHCTDGGDSGAGAVAGSCKQKKVRLSGRCAAAPVSEPDSGGGAECRVPPWVKLAACHEP